jgi:hypothetical protein
MVPPAEDDGEEKLLGPPSAVEAAGEVEPVVL